jgi:hypothetical protein
MSHAERAERIRNLVAALSADEAERDRLKGEADEALARLHEAARDFVTGAGRGTGSGAPPSARPAAV